jgi:hypothetical protein
MDAFAMFIGGRLQDKLGPRITAVIGGILVGLASISSRRRFPKVSSFIGHELG